MDITRQLGSDAEEVIHLGLFKKQKNKKQLVK